MNDIRILSGQAWSLWRIAKSDTILLVSEDVPGVKIESVEIEKSTQELTVRSLSISETRTVLSESDHVSNICEEALVNHLAIYDMTIEDAERLYFDELLATRSAYQQVQGRAI